MQTLEAGPTLGLRLQPGDVADRLFDYLYARSTGHIGSLMTLVTRGAHHAVRRDVETLTVELLDGITIDDAAEQARPALTARLTSHGTHSRPGTKPTASRGASGGRARPAGGGG